jgi:ribosomal protein S8
MLSKKTAIVTVTILFFVSVHAFLVAEPNVDSAKGTFTWNGQTYQIKYSYATPTKDPFDEKKIDAFLVLLTDGPIEEDVSKLSRFGMTRIFEKRNLHGIVFGIDGKNNLFFTDVPGGFNGTGIAKFEPGQMNPSLVQGRIYTNGMEEYFKDTYQFDIRFQAAVKAEKVIDAKSGTALSKDGGEPGKAYLAYSKAAQAGDLESMLKYKQTTPEQIQEMEKMKKESPEKYKQSIAMLTTFAAKDIRIIEGYINDNEAMLTVEAVGPLSPKRVRGNVEMKQVDGQWKVMREKWDTVKL